MGPFALRLFAAGWIVLALLLAIGTVGEAGLLLKSGPFGARTWLPLGLRPGDGFNQVQGVAPEAAAAGVHPGDRIIMARGLPIDAAKQGEEAARTVLRDAMVVGEGDAVPMVLQRGDGTVHRVTLIHRARSAHLLLAPAGLSPDVLTVAAIGFFGMVPLGLGIASAMLVSRRRETVAALLCLALLALGAVAGNQGTFWQEIGMAWMAFALANLGVGGLAVALLAFPAGHFVPAWTRWIAFAVLPVLVIGLLMPDITLFAVIAVLVVPVIVLIVRYRAEPAEARRQWRWAMLGFVLGLGVWITMGLLTSYVVYPVLPYEVVGPWSWLTTSGIFAVAALLMAGGLVLSLLRYRLYDAPVVISQSVLYGGLTLSLVAIFAGTEKVIEIIGEEWFGESIGALAGGLGAAFAAVAIGPLHHRIGHFVEHRFRADLVHLRRDGPALIAEMMETGDRALLITSVCALLAERLHVVGVAVAVGAEPHAHGADPVIHGDDPHWPIRADLGQDQVLRLGPRPDGSLCDAQEREVIGDIAARMGRALRIMAARQAREDALLSRIARIEAALVARP